MIFIKNYRGCDIDLLLWFIIWSIICSIYNILPGLHNGTCTLLEKKLGRNLLWLPCRHHINEIILRSVFEIHFAKTSGPNVSIFNKFEATWSSINQNNFEIGLKDKLVLRALNDDTNALSNFIFNELEVRIIVILNKIRFVTPKI